MIKLVVLYGQPTDPAAFDQYYTDTHAPLARKIPNLKRFEAGTVLGTPDGGQAPYHYIAELYFDSVEVLRASMGSEEGQAASNDLPKFATGGLTMLIVEA